MGKKATSIIMLAASISIISCSSGVSPEGKAEIVALEVPDKYRTPLEEGAGSVESFSYQTQDYLLGSGKSETKYANVYLPHGYDENGSYDVIYLLHGTDPQSKTHQDTWLYEIGVKDILDNLIHYGDIKPLIVVAPTFYCYGIYGDDTSTNLKEYAGVKQQSSDNFAYELRNDLIPAVEGHYATYAEGTDEASLKASRDHRAMAGLSNGCRITLNAGMIGSFDYISYFGCYSSSVDSSKILEALDSEKYAGLKLNYMFNADGIYDFAYNAHRKMVDALLESEHFDSANTEYVEVPFGYHSARSWRVGFYDSLLRFFK